MSKPTLYIRNPHPRSLSPDRSPHVGFRAEGSFDSYREAVLQGQRLGGYGNFYVYTGELKAPTREEQLLLESKPKRRKKNPMLDEAQLID